MSFNTDNIETWDWQGMCDMCDVLDDSFDVSKCLWIDEKQQEDVSLMFDDQTSTPIEDCGGELSNFINGCEETNRLDECEEPPSKKPRMLRFDSDGLDPSNLGDMSFSGLKSKERAKAIEENLSELSSNWDSVCVALCDGDEINVPDGTLSQSDQENLDKLSEAWLASLFDDVDNPQMSSNDKIPTSQTDTVVSTDGTCPVKTLRNGLKGKESYMKTTPTATKPSSYVAYPFGFLKPSSFHGDVTLKDINERILTRGPPPSSGPTSGFSGKPVVGAKTIRTEGGKGAITILRTSG